MDLFKIPRFVAAEDGDARVDPKATLVSDGGGFHGDGGGGGGDDGGGSKESVPNRGPQYLQTKPRGIRAKASDQSNFPRVIWTKPSDDGVPVDRAATFDPDNNILKINEDFRLFSTEEDAICEQVSKKTGRPIGKGEHHKIRRAVRSWNEQALIEAILGGRALEGSSEWSGEDLKKFWSPEALTAVVSFRTQIVSRSRNQVSSAL